MRLFHSAPIRLAPGSVVLPGNYGRIIQSMGSGHPLWGREMALEGVRLERYPEKPSRLQSCFTCVEELTARFYITAMAKKDVNYVFPLLYEVEKLEPNAIEHRADFNVVQPLPGNPAAMSDIAHHYWNASLWVTIVEVPGMRCEELITTSPLRILKALDQ